MTEEESFKMSAKLWQQMARESKHLKKMEAGPEKERAFECTSEREGGGFECIAEREGPGSRDQLKPERLSWYFLSDFTLGSHHKLA